MHPSYFCIVSAEGKEPSEDLALSAEVSEWLFYAKFWETLNAKLGLQFSQYEDDVLPRDSVAIALNCLKELSSEQLVDPSRIHQVTYGWNDKGERLQFSAAAQQLASGVNELAALLSKAGELGSDVYCQL